MSMVPPLEPAHAGHLAFIRALIRDGAALGSFDRELAVDCPSATLFYANLRCALQSGYFVQCDPARGTMPVHANGYVYRPPAAESPIGFGLFREYAGNWFEFWLLAISPQHRRRGHGRAMVRALLTTPVGRLAQLARCNRTSHGSEIVVRLLREVGFVPRRATAQQTWLVHERAPDDFVRQVTDAPVIQLVGD